MIKTKFGETTIIANDLAEVLTDVACIAKTISESNNYNAPKDKRKEMLHSAIDIAFMTKEEREAETKKRLMEAFDKLSEKLFGKDSGEGDANAD